MDHPARGPRGDQPQAQVVRGENGEGGTVADANDTYVCRWRACGHVKWRHRGPDGKIGRCSVTGCECNASSYLGESIIFLPAKYTGKDHVEPPGNPISG